jgi:hypothetical protein
MRGAILSARPASAAFARDWPMQPAVQRVRTQFDGIGGCPKRGVDVARRLLGDPHLLPHLLAQPLATLAADPFFDPPFRVHRDAVRTTAILIEHPAARLSVTLVDAAAARAQGFPAAFVLPGRIAVSRHLGGEGAVLHQWRAQPVSPAYRIADDAPCRRLPARPLATGDIRIEDGRTEGQIVWPGDHNVLTLSIVLGVGAAPLLREGRVTDGRIVRAATLDSELTRTAIHLRLLRALGRADAGPHCAAATRDPAFHLRWEAMREWLLLGDPAALPRLGQMAVTDPHPDVRAAARATLAATMSRAA